MTRSFGGGKDLNTGQRLGLLDAKHTRAMGKADWLFNWLVARQTKANGAVFGGSRLSYAEIAGDTGWAERTIRRWMAKLRDLGYISVKHSTYRHMVIHVLNQKKYESLQLRLPGVDAVPSRPEVAESLRPEVAGDAARSGRINHRVEKEHRNQRNPAAKPAAVGVEQHLPEWIPSAPWRDYEEMRRVIRKPLTVRARELAIEQLAQLQTAGHDPKLVLEQSIFHCWVGLFPLRGGNANGRDFSATDRVLDQLRDGPSGLDPRVVEAALSKRPS